MAARWGKQLPAPQKHLNLLFHLLCALRAEIEFRLHRTYAAHCTMKGMPTAQGLVVFPSQVHRCIRPCCPCSFEHLSMMLVP